MVFISGRQNIFAILAALASTAYANTNYATESATSHKVLILGGGVSGVIAARTLHEHGIEDFKIVEARDELGGRLKSFKFGIPGNKYTLELGANWIQGTETNDGSGSVNPIWTLAKKHKLHTHFNDWYGSITTYDASGQVDYLDTFDESGDQFDNLAMLAGARVQNNLVDLSSRSGYSLTGSKPQTQQAQACEYYQLDWESGSNPEESSWLATAWNYNFTYLPEFDGFGDDDEMSLDQRGFKAIIQAEANEFLQPWQVQLDSTVKNITYSADGVTVVLASGQRLQADYVLTTFSLGVLQNDDVTFHPILPTWKEEAIQSMSMSTYTKIFLQFPQTFWFSTEMGLYADSERGRYPVWQSLDHVDFLPGSHILFVTVTGEFSRRVEALSDLEVQTEVMDVVRSMFPNVTVPDPIAFHFPRWHSDPLYRGSYSNWPPSFTVGHQQNLQATVDRRLWFAGKYTSLKYYGFLHGAYFSGMEVGGAIAKCVLGHGCVEYPHVPSVTNTQPYRF